MTEHELGQRLLWVPMGGLLGAFSGAVVGAVYLLGWVVADSWDDNLVSAFFGATVLGAIYGGIAGFVVGLFVGVEMMFLMGTRLARDVARRRAFVLGLVLPPVTMLGLLQVGALMGGSGLLTLSLDAGHVDAGDLGALVLLGGGSLMGGHLARWLAGWERPHVRVS